MGHYTNLFNILYNKFVAYYKTNIFAISDHCLLLLQGIKMEERRKEIKKFYR